MTFRKDQMENEGVGSEKEIKPLARARKRLQRKEEAAQPPKPKQSKAERAARTAPARGAKRVDVLLTMPHWVNGIAYGPGPTKVPADLLPGLLDTEQRVRQNDADLMGHKAAYIGPGGRRMPVPYELFNSPMLNILEAMTI